MFHIPYFLHSNGGMYKENVPTQSSDPFFDSTQPREYIYTRAKRDLMNLFEIHCGVDLAKNIGGGGCKFWMGCSSD